MCTKCGDKIASALTDPETKATIDLLNACDMRDQVGSHRVIVSYETPQLEEFSLCILQQQNCMEARAHVELLHYRQLVPICVDALLSVLC